MPGRSEAVNAAQTLEGTFFRHFKGNYYQLLAVAAHSETQEPYAVYRALYGDGSVWVRPLPMFLEQIERDGQRIRRFTPVAPEAVPEQALAYVKTPDAAAR